MTIQIQVSFLIKHYNLVVTKDHFVFREEHMKLNRIDARESFLPFLASNLSKVRRAGFLFIFNQIICFMS